MIVIANSHVFNWPSALPFENKLRRVERNRHGEKGTIPLVWFSKLQENIMLSFSPNADSRNLQFTRCKSGISEKNTAMKTNDLLIQK